MERLSTEFRDGIIKLRMRDESTDLPVWTPSRRTRVEVPGFCLMHGGPRGMRLPEHEHPEVQIEAHFFPTIPGGAPHDNPRFFRIIPSGQPHVGRWEDGTEVIVILANRSSLDRAASDLGKKSSWDLLPLNCGYDSVVHSLAGALRREFCERAVDDPLFAEAIGTVLIGHLMRTWCTDARRLTYRGRLSDDRLRSTLDVIAEKLSSRLTIQMLANNVGMGTHQFTIQFRKATGRTPYQFITELRVARARDLLEKTTLPLAEIAFRLGFSSQSHFTSVFREHLRITPWTYRASFDH